MNIDGLKVGTQFAFFVYTLLQGIVYLHEKNIGWAVLFFSCAAFALVVASLNLNEAFR